MSAMLSERVSVYLPVPTRRRPPTGMRHVELAHDLRQGRAAAFQALIILRSVCLSARVKAAVRRRHFERATSSRRRSVGPTRFRDGGVGNGCRLLDCDDGAKLPFRWSESDNVHCVNAVVAAVPPKQPPISCGGWRLGGRSALTKPTRAPPLQSPSPVPSSIQDDVQPALVRRGRQRRILGRAGLRPNRSSASVATYATVW